MDDLQRSQSLDLTDYLARHIGSVSFDAAQANRWLKSISQWLCA